MGILSMRFGAFRQINRCSQQVFGLRYRAALVSYRPLACMAPKLSPSFTQFCSLTNVVMDFSGDFAIEAESSEDDLATTSEELETRKVGIETQHNVNIGILKYVENVLLRL
eukprot:GDKJ01000052.1.p1 GENE.GDKJ01000052.1~~GDKJ01000052.1.p1  ORF type:complete len:111 (+),score=21.41 GDKJ01000052.1:1-333(+)